MLFVPALAYWYDGGRPSGCCGFMTASEVVDAAGFGGADACDCDDAEVEGTAESVPLELAAGFGTERLVAEEEFCEATD